MPYLSYNILVWGNASASHIHDLFVLQKRAVRIITNSSYISHTAGSFKTLCILPVFELYEYHLGIFMYKYLHNKLPNSFDNYFNYNNDYHSYNTRSSGLLRQPLHRISVSQRHVKTSGVKLWNSLPNAILNSKSIMIFKRTLKKYLIDKSMKNRW